MDEILYYSPNYERGTCRSFNRASPEVGCDDKYSSARQFGAGCPSTVGSCENTFYFKAMESNSKCRGNSWSGSPEGAEDTVDFDFFRVTPRAHFTPRTRTCTSAAPAALCRIGHTLCRIRPPLRVRIGIDRVPSDGLRFALRWSRRRNGGEVLPNPVEDRATNQQSLAAAAPRRAACQGALLDVARYHGAPG